jgi:CelD/BcsL family acetyltransferase involved in cellulose biosynthesis
VAPYLHIAHAAVTRDSDQIAFADLPKTGTSNDLSVHVASRWDDLEQFQSVWEDLLTERPDASIFLTPQWLGSWWRSFGRNKELLGLVFLDQHRQVIAIAPLYRERVGFFPFRSNRLRLVGAGSGDSDALDFIVKPGAEARVANTFLEWLDKNKDFGVCSLETIPKTSAIGCCLQQLLGRRRWSVLTDEEVNYVIDLPATWQGYLQTLDPKFRPLLTRYPKRLHTRYQGVRISRHEDLARLNAALETLFELHQMRWTGRGEAGAFASSERRAFYSHMAEAFLRRGWLEFWRLELDGHTVAAQFCFRYRDTVYLLQEGFDPKYSADKVGYALRARVLETIIQSGAKRYDFLGGSDSYKAKFGARAGSYLNLHFAGPSRLGRAYLAHRRQSLQAKGWLKNHMPVRWLAAMHNPKGQQSTPT